jgi:CD2 antigen cytoplasmic tail-binding protein 2
MPPRPKRPTHPISHSNDALNRSGAGLAPSKRPKFDARNPHLAAPDAPDDEADLFLEVDEGAIGKRKVHRNAVELEGYETDSSEEGFEATHKQWAKDEKGKGKAKDEDDDDDDMFGGEFAEEEKEKVEEKRGKQKKDVRFLEIDEIEGQEEEGELDAPVPQKYPDIFKDERRDDEESSDDEEKLAEEGLDEEVGAGGRKSHAPKREAFNMKSEMEEGRFDTAGNFVRKAAEKDAIHDSWLTGISKKEMKKAKEAMDKREAERREQMRRDDEVLTSEVLARLIAVLDKGESILEALARFGGKKKAAANKNKNQWRQKKKAAADAAAADEMQVDTQGKGKDTTEDPEEVKRKAMVETITGAADVLLTRGQLEVYDETRESLMRQYRQETGEDWVDRKAEDEGAGSVAAELRQWEYRWTDGRDDGSTYGPYGNPEMKSWNDHGFFGEGIEFRLVGSAEGWTRAASFD